jgi:hypothetical protein
MTDTIDVITQSEPSVIESVSDNIVITTIESVNNTIESVDDINILIQTQDPDILITTQEIIPTIIESIATGPQGPPSNLVIPEDITINRTDNEISSIEYESGKTITINRSNGEITSIDDGEYLKTIVRENNEITGIIIS